MQCLFAEFASDLSYGRIRSGEKYGKFNLDNYVWLPKRLCPAGGAEKVITRNYLYSLKYVGLWEDGSDVNVDNLYKLVKGIAEHISDTSELGQEMETLRKETTARGYNFFHFLFSLPLKPGDEHFDGFMDILKKCFPDERIPREIAGTLTEGLGMNILHLAILSGSTYVGKLILNNVEDTLALDVGDLRGNTPLFLVVDKYIDAHVERVAGGSKEDLLDLLDKMLEKGFSLSRENKYGCNFLAETINSAYNLPYEGKVDSKSNKKALAALVKLLGHLKKVSKKNERVKRELDEVYSSYKDNLTEEADKGLLKKIDKMIK